MATTVISGQTTVGTEPTLIATGIVGASHITLHFDGNVNAYLGDATVTTATGFELHKGDTVTLWLPESGKLYAVVASGTETLTWLLTGGR